MSRTLSAEVQNMLVMVRTYGDKPVRLLARTQLGGAVELEFEDGGNAILFPAEDVYRFDGELFAELGAAAQAGDKQRLAMCWGKAETFGSR